MAAMDKITRVRERHIPEEDTRVQKERAKHAQRSDGTSGVFGKNSSNIEDARVYRIENLKEQIARSREHLQNVNPDDLEHRAVSEAIQEKERLIAELEQEKGKNLKQDFKYLAEDLRVYFRRPFNDSVKTEHVVTRLRAMFLVPEIREKVESLFGQDLKELTSENLKHWIV